MNFEIGNDLQGGSKVVQIREIFLLKNKHVFLCRCDDLVFLNVVFNFEVCPYRYGASGICNIISGLRDWPDNPDELLDVAQSHEQGGEEKR